MFQLFLQSFRYLYIHCITYLHIHCITYLYIHCITSLKEQNQFYSKIQKVQLQGTLIPKLTLGPFLTLSVRNGHKLKDWGLGSRPISRVKVNSKNYNHHFIKHHERQQFRILNYFLKSKIEKNFFLN